MDRVANSCIDMGNLCLSKAAGKKRDVAAAENWFRKALELDANAKWWDWLILYARLWRCRCLDVVSK